MITEAYNAGYQLVGRGGVGQGRLRNDSNLGYALLGQVIERVSGTSYEAYIQAHVFRPLGLAPEDIHFGTQDYAVDARPYFRRSQLLYQVLARFVLKGAELRRQGAWVGLDNRFYLNAPAHGGIIAGAESYAAVFRELLRSDSRLLGEEARALLFTEQARSGRTAFALAWSIGNGTAGASTATAAEAWATWPRCGYTRKAAWDRCY